MGGCQSKKDAKSPRQAKDKNNNNQTKDGQPKKQFSILKHQIPDDIDEENQDRNSNRSQQKLEDNQIINQSSKSQRENEKNLQKRGNQKQIQNSSKRNSNQQELEQDTNQGGDKQKQNNLIANQNKNESSLILDPHSPNFDNSLLDIIEASYKGNIVLVDVLIEKFELKDISTLVGYSQQIRLGKGRNTKSFKSTELWNPLLYAIAGRQEEIIKIIFEKIPTFHRINCLSKPFTLQKQKQMAFDNVKRVKRESFGLNLSILNQDEKTFKYLWNENRILWNLGHFMQCLRKILQNDWDTGLKILMASTTSKVIFMSINDVQDFIDCIDLIRQELIYSEKANPKLGQKLRDYLSSRPYYIYAIFLEIADFTDKPNRDLLQSCLSKLSQDDIQFKHKDLKQLFDILDDTSCLEQFRDRMLIKFEDRDSEIERYQRGLARLFEKENSVDSVDHLGILEDLDLFAFNNITVNGQTTNAMVEALKRGFEHMINYCFNQNEGFINLRSIIRKNNKYEVQNDIAKKHVEFFSCQAENIPLFKQIFHNLVDLYQLSNLLEVFQQLKTHRNCINLISFILTDPKFISLFQTSLELQKYLFVIELVVIVEKNDLEFIKNIILQQPYRSYYSDVKKGNVGSAYTKVTIGHLEQLEEKKVEQTKKKKSLKTLVSRGSGLIEFTEFLSGSPTRQKKNPDLLKNLDQDINGQEQMDQLQNDIQNRKNQLDKQGRNNSKNLTPVLERPSENKETEIGNNQGMGKQLTLQSQFDQTKDKLQIQTPSMKKGVSENPNLLIHSKLNQENLLQIPGQNQNNKRNNKNSPLSSIQDRQSIGFQEKQSSIKSINAKQLLGQSQNQTDQVNLRDIQIQLKGQLNNQTKGMRPSMESELNLKLDTQKDKLDFLSSLKREQASPQQRLKQSQAKDKENLNQHQNKLVEQENKLQEKKSLLKDKDDSQDDENNDDFGIGSADASDDEENNKSRQMSQRLPNILEKKQSTRNPLQDILNNKELENKSYERLPIEIIESIRSNNLQKLKYLLTKFNIKNITWIKHVENETALQIKGYDFPEQGEKDLKSKQNSSDKSMRGNIEKVLPTYDVSMWNPVLYAIYYERTDMFRLLLSKYVTNYTLALRLPPVNEFTEYIIPGQRQAYEPWGEKARLNFQNETDNSFSMSPDNHNKSTFVIPYNPTDARVECFGIELAIRNQDLQTLMILWNEQNGLWEERHFAYIFDKILQEHWDVGLGCLFRSRTSHMIFKALNPEDKDNFLFSKIVDKITDTEYWEREQQFMEHSVKQTQITETQVQLVIQELSNEPYGSYACLKYPQLFEKFEVLENSLQKVKQDDIYEYVIARKENQRHLSEYIQSYIDNKSNKNKKVIEILKQIQTKSQEIEGAKRKTPTDPKDIVQLIKFGDLQKLKDFFEKEDNRSLLDQLNQLQGHIDNDYQKLYQSNVKYIPSDETIQILLADNSTYEWNPLIFAIFYQKKEMVQYFCEQKQVYVRNCLTTPFIIEVDEDAEDLDEEKFIKEKTELFCLVMCIMLHNKEIFKYLWRQCAYMWNDIHFVTLANFIFESQWLDGIKILFASANAHQIFNAMNMYEKEKFLKFCDKSITKINPNAMKDFRYQMSFDPYNIYYLPILVGREDLLAWDKDEVSKELFIKNCQLNFDERSFAMLSKLNSHYVGEFISTAAEGSQSEAIANFARKLRRYLGQSLAI